MNYEPNTNETQTFADAVLARQNAILKLLNKSPVQKISEKYLAERLGS